jgi:hypothetical protein
MKKTREKKTPSRRKSRSAEEIARIARQIHWRLGLERGKSAAREVRMRMLIGLPPVPRPLVGRERGK